MQSILSILHTLFFRQPKWRNMQSILEKYYISMCKYVYMCVNMCLLSLQSGLSNIPHLPQQKLCGTITSKQI